jgi:hypothetical protein
MAARPSLCVWWWGEGEVFLWLQAIAVPCCTCRYAERRLLEDRIAALSAELSARDALDAETEACSLGLIQVCYLKMRQLRVCVSPVVEAQLKRARVAFPTTCHDAGMTTLPTLAENSEAGGGEDLSANHTQCAVSRVLHI